MSRGETDPLPQLVRGLASDDTAARVRAAQALGRLGPLAAEAIPDLERALGDDGEAVREAAAQALGHMGERAVSILARAVTHADKRVRRQAVWALGRLGAVAAPAIPALCSALQDADPRTSAGAAQTLGNIGPDAEPAIAALAAALRDPNMVLCRLAAQALSRIGPPALPALLEALLGTDPYVRREAALALGWMGPAASSAVDHLIEMLRSDPTTRTTPTTPVNLSSQQQTIATMIVPRKTADDTHRVYAAQALGRIGATTPEVMTALTDALSDTNSSVREAAASALSQLHGKNNQPGPANPPS